MLIYSIREKASGRYFVGTDGLGRVNWIATPVFFKTPDGIAVNLKRLCSQFCEVKDAWGWWQKHWKNFDPKKLDLFEIIVWEVDVLSTKVIPAKEFVQIDAIESKKVSKIEKRAA